MNQEQLDVQDLALRNALRENGVPHPDAMAYQMAAPLSCRERSAKPVHTPEGQFEPSSDLAEIDDSKRRDQPSDGRVSTDDDSTKGAERNAVKPIDKLVSF